MSASNLSILCAVFFACFLQLNVFAQSIVTPGQFFDEITSMQGGTSITPSYMTKRPNGKIYILNKASNKIVVLDNQNMSELILDQGSGMGEPAGFDFDGEGNLYVVDKENDRILKYNENGIFNELFAPINTENLSSPEDLVISPEGILFVSNTGTNQIFHYDVKENTFLGVLDPSGSAPLSTPSHLLVYSNILLVSSKETNSVLQYDIESKAFISELVQSHPELDEPTGMVIGPDSLLYVASSGTSAINRYNAESGEFLGVFVEGTGTPFDLQFDYKNKVLSSSISTDTILKYWGPSNTIFVNSARSTIANDGECTFHEAISNANDNATTFIDCVSGLGPDVIAFNISGQGPFVIRPVQKLPDIIDALFIDGYSQSGSETPTRDTPAVLKIEIDGSEVEEDTDGITISYEGDFSRISGLAIHSFGGQITQNNIKLLGTSNNVIDGCVIGGDVEGRFEQKGAANGIYIASSSKNIIGGSVYGTRNVISGNSSGIRIDGSNSSENVITGNYIGTNLTGLKPSSNIGSGITIYGYSVRDPRHTSYGNIIGGVTDEERNVISGNQKGITIHNLTSNTKIIGNYIGTDKTGTLKLANSITGISIEDSESIYVERNLMSNNISGAGIALIGTTNSFISENIIGLDLNLSTKFPNVHGVYLRSSSANTIQNNIISGNHVHEGAVGIHLFDDSNENEIKYNFIGTTPDGQRGVFNRTGVIIEKSSENLLNGNTISSNSQNGLLIKDSSYSNVVTGNTITSNLFNGIELHDLETRYNKIQGNYIGIGKDQSATSDMGNALNGVYIHEGASQNEIGGPSNPLGNTIQYNGQNGILIEGSSTTMNSIRYNRISLNTEQAIDLQGEGLSENDNNDIDEGPNNLQNFPVLSNAVQTYSDSVKVTFIVDSPPTFSDYSISIDFFEPSQEEINKNSESRGGERFIGSVQYSQVDYESGQPLTVSFFFSGDLPAQISAIATDASGNSSEFSRSIFVEPLPQGPVLTPPEPRMDSFPSSVNVDVGWSFVSDAVIYKLEVAIDALFESLIVEESELTDLSHQVRDLEVFRRYYWRVRACRTKADSSCSDTSEVYNFVVYPNKQDLDDSISVFFGDSRELSSWRLLGLPGSNATKFSATLSGVFGEDWKAFSVNGQGELVPVDATSLTYGNGRAYWILAKSTWDVPLGKVNSVPLVSDDSGAVAIPIVPGWNLITNPFTVPVSWATVVSSNEGEIGPIHSFDGKYSIADSLKTYEGYFFFNTSSSRTKLIIPVPATNDNLLTSKKERKSLIALRLKQDSLVSEIRIGEHEGASAQQDSLDIYSPPMLKGGIGLSIENKALTTAYKHLAEDYRPTSRRQEYRIAVSTIAGRIASLEVDLNEELLNGRSVILVDERTGEKHDLNDIDDINLMGNGETRYFRLEVTSESPADFVRDNNPITPQVEVYPNPVKDRATIKYHVESDVQGPVRINVYNMIGQRVATILNQAQSPGVHELYWDVRGAGLPSGVYQIRIRHGISKTDISVVL